MGKNNKKRTHQEFVEELKKKNSKIKVIGVYQTSHDKIECYCLDCHTTWFPKPYKLLSGQGCPSCGEKKCRLSKRMKNDCFISNLHTVNPNIIPLENYITGRTKIWFRCNVCSNEWQTTPQVVLNGHNCPVCSHKEGANKIKKSKKEFIEEVNLINPNIEIIGDYINDMTKIDFLCKICGTKWKVTPNNILHKSGCPKCKESKGENRIDNYLLNKEITFIRQYKFNDCKNILALPFDFYLPKNNICIEYDGLLHYKAVDYFGGEEALKATQMRDEIKTNYCKEHNIKLIRIPYWDFNNIEDILNKELEVG